MDTSLLHYVIQLRRPWLDDVMILASALGAGGFIWVIFGSIAGIFPQHTKAMWRLWLAVALSFVLVDGIVKPFAHRARPYEVLPEITLIDAMPTSASFPSGHAAMAVWLLWPIALLVSVSRMYLGVHWPSDVLVGALLGFLCAWFVLGRLKAPARVSGH
jgi:undecaprenyl-diphosphatase